MASFIFRLCHTINFAQHTFTCHGISYGTNLNSNHVWMSPKCSALHIDTKWGARRGSIYIWLLGYVLIFKCSWSMNNHEPLPQSLKVERPNNVDKENSPFKSPCPVFCHPNDTIFPHYITFCVQTVLLYFILLLTSCINLFLYSLDIFSHLWKWFEHLG